MNLFLIIFFVCQITFNVFLIIMLRNSFKNSRRDLDLLKEDVLEADQEFNQFKTSVQEFVKKYYNE